MLVVVMIIQAGGNDCGDIWLQMWRMAGYGNGSILWYKLEGSYGVAGGESR